VLAARSLPQLEELAQKASALGSEVLVIKTDVTKVNELDSLLTEIKNKYGRLDILINNAGKGLYGKWENSSLESHKDLFNLNFLSGVELTRKAIPL